MPPKYTSTDNLTDWGREAKRLNGLTKAMIVEYIESLGGDASTKTLKADLIGAVSRMTAHQYDSQGNLLPTNGTQEESTPDPTSKVDTMLRAKDQGPAHVVIVARAGTGKTTTLVEGLKAMRGLPTKITPSPQQEAIWTELRKSESAKSVCFVAFNKSIATELQARVPAGCNAMTMHSMGLKAVTAAFGRVQINAYRVSDIISETTERDIRELRKNSPVLLKATEDLVGMCKMNLADPTREDLEELASYYDVDLNGSRDQVMELVPQVVERCKDVARDGCIDFNDMIWLPVALGLNVYRYDLLLVDEAQDLNRCQQSLAKMAGRRLVLCGDPKQAIYGFAGADAQSMPRMISELSATPQGCVELPLTVTRRCGHAIVKEANKYVRDFSAHESNGPGGVGTARYDGEKDTYHSQVQDGNMILCRVNAPLVSQCFKFLKMGRKANIQGRDIGQGLISTVRKMKATNTTGLIEKLSDWLHRETTKEQAKRNPNENKIIALQDRVDCIICFCDGLDTPEQVISKIEGVFTDDRSNTGIKLSSIHKAKGLEADTVWFLQPKGATVPHPMAKSDWQKAQEYNILYVGITRAINTLVFVS